MITVNKYGNNANEKTMEIYGLSTDTKPTDTYAGCKIINGSTYLEMDTSKVFMYNGDADTWLEL